jgi:hypothetical protein
MPVHEEKQLHAGQASHPAEDHLLRFMRGESSANQARAIVRHLLTGCQPCVAITRRCWERGERFPGLAEVVRATMAAVRLTARRS